MVKLSTLNKIILLNPIGSAWGRTFISLSSRDYRLLWIGTILMVSAYQMQMLAQGYLVYSLTGSAQILGIVIAGSAIPMLMLPLLGGVIADRFTGKRLVQFAQLGLTLVAFSIAISITVNFMTWQFLLMAAVSNGIIWSFNGPARHALIPQLVSTEHTANSIALMGTGMSLAGLVAPLIGGLIYSIAGAEVLYYTVASCQFMSVCFTTAINKKVRKIVKSSGRIMTDLQSGIIHVWNDHGVRNLLLIGIVILMLGAPFMYFLPVLIIDVYQKGTGSLGLLVSAVGIGALAGTLWVASTRDKLNGPTILKSGLILASGLLVGSLVSDYQIAIPIMVVIGFGNAFSWSLLQVSVLSRVPVEYRGRVMSMFMIMYGMVALTVYPSGILADMVGARIVLFTLGLILMTFIALVFFMQRKFNVIS